MSGISGDGYLSDRWLEDEGDVPFAVWNVTYQIMYLHNLSGYFRFCRGLAVVQKRGSGRSPFIDVVRWFSH